MTRWARSGNTQKHSKQPADPTPWEEFAQQKDISGNAKNKKGIFRKNTKSEQADGAEHGEATTSTDITSGGHSSDKKNKKHKKFKGVPIEKGPQQSTGGPERQSLTTGEAEPENVSEIQENNSRGYNSRPPTQSMHKNRYKSNKFLDKVRENRAQNGILLLPPKVEQNLYNMKKSMRSNGMPEEKIKEFTRQARRKAELRFRKTLKPCYKCRKIGHMLASCPLAAADVDQGTGICFKCGSTEHTSYACKLKTTGFPFAKCFICNKMGHLSRQCPQNKNGAYPKGGQCKCCGEIDHLVKDCPQLQKRDDDELTVDVIGKLTSVDDEIIEEKASSFSVRKKPKVVKF